ncbi:MAG: SAM-dependent methyltransferase, partial [Gammaproteobacteria bacterium]
MQPDEHTSLPAPDALSRSHSARVVEFIRQRIAAAGGSISFAEYMQHALYAPGLGYYAAGAVKFGADGDFVTAPEISSLFGSVLARQCAEVLLAVDNGAILEFGAGSGRLAADLLTRLDALDQLPARYDILEVSADLRERQETCLKERVPSLLSRVRWVEEPPRRHVGVIVANEVMDALPVERFLRTN